MYKTILVHVDATADSARRIDVAARLASRYEAHLVGAAMTGLAAYMMPIGGFDAGIPQIVFPVEELRADANRALDLFDKRAGSAGVHSVERRMVDDEAAYGLSVQARYSDLVVVSRAPHAGPARGPSDVPQTVLLNGARPVLVLPPAADAPDIGRRVTVAWNGSAEAVRAITTAIPLLQRAQMVDLAMFNAVGDVALQGRDPGADMALYLARHGIKVEVTAADAGQDDGQALLAFASSRGADLLVMGAYGHSRFREFLLGGMTRTALSASPIPLWMCH